MLEVKSGDLFIEGSEKYGDYREQLISWEEYYANIENYCKQVGCPTDPDVFVAGLREQLTSDVLSVDALFPFNESVSIQNGQPVIRKLTNNEKPKGLDVIEDLLAQRIPECNIMDVLS